MIAYGVLALACAALGWLIVGIQAAFGLSLGVAMIAAGSASAQGRRSLRKTGNFLGMFLPVIAAGFYGWRALDGWRHHQPGAQILPLVLLTILASAGLITVLVLLKLRGGDGIAERGYSVLPIVPASAEARAARHAESQ
jgi:hypothetical protein